MLSWTRSRISARRSVSSHSHGGFMVPRSRSSGFGRFGIVPRETTGAALLASYSPRRREQGSEGLPFVEHPLRFIPKLGDGLLPHENLRVRDGVPVDRGDRPLDLFGRQIDLLRLPAL